MPLNVAWTIKGPMKNGNLLVMAGEKCAATVNVKDGPDAQAIGNLLARAASRTIILQHLLTELQTEPERWEQEIKMIADELRQTGHDQ